MSENKCICGSVTTKRCSRCKSKHYCSRECQKNDWSNHKSDCKTPAKPPAGAKPDAKPPAKTYVREISEEEHKSMSSFFAVCYLKSRDGRRFLPSNKGDLGSVLRDSIEWETPEQEAVSYKKWMSGEST